MSDVFTFGETMALMKASTAGALAHVATLDLGIGGAESNVAVALRRLGTSVTWAGRVGQDSLGDLILRELTAEGLDIRPVRDGRSPTGLMIREHRTPDVSRVWYYRSGSAGSRLCPEDLPADAITSAQVLHVTGITPALSASAADAVRSGIITAKGAGVRVSFDVNYRSALWPADVAGAAYRDIVGHADVVFAGDDEARLLVSATDPAELARKLTDLGPGQAVVKLGGRGAVAHIDGRDYRVPAVPVRAVDTVGAGDAFVAGYLADLLLDAAPEQRLETAALVGAFACSIPGDWEGNPRRADLSVLTAADPVQR